MSKSRDRFKPLSKLVELCLNEGREAFEAEYSDSLLILDDVADDAGEVGFQTIRVGGTGEQTTSDPTNPIEKALTMILGHLSGSPNKWVYPLSNESGKFAAMYTVGRAANSDMRLNVASLSKFHAYFTHVARDNAWFLADAGSSNGTFLNGKELPPSHGKVRLDSGATIRFGPDVSGSFYTAAGFWELLQSCLNDTPAGAEKVGGAADAANTES